MATTTQYSPSPAFTPATGRQLWPTTLHQCPLPPPPSPGGATMGMLLATFEAWATSVEDYRNICGWALPVAAPYRRCCLPLLESFSDVVRVCEIVEAAEKASEQPSCDLPHGAPQPSEVAAAGPISCWPTGQGKHRQEVSQRGRKRCTACGDSECTEGALLTLLPRPHLPGRRMCNHPSQRATHVWCSDRWRCGGGVKDYINKQDWRATIYRVA
ncbi:hypothetical protein E2C01_093306 [Portunus trituberculatus]|uniref:Uncharacterized protein n=1 Tax=Portunus trituberculatus TaxID=210409 RepID=A0A5B7JT19_PORTR|nr:hypothetical protein [Portunus trituberculatus]